MTDPCASGLTPWAVPDSRLMATLPAAPAAAPTVAYPPVPRSVEATGLPFSFLCDLVLKVLYFQGSMLGRDIARHVCLPFSLVETTLKFLADASQLRQGHLSELFAGKSNVTLKTLVKLQLALLFFLMTFGRIAIVTIIPVRILRARCLGQSQHQR